MVVAPVDSPGFDDTTEIQKEIIGIAARWDLRLADGASVHSVTSSTLVPNELSIAVTRRSPVMANTRYASHALAADWSCFT